jgi:Spy/CpxP family protein refolding chaperone
MDMKKLIGSIFALTLFVSASQAQDRNEHRHQGRFHQKEMLTKDLNFSEDQKKQLKEINADVKKQMADLEKNDNITVKEYRTRKEAIKKDQQQKFQALLTPEQKSKLNKMKEERIAKAKERNARGLERMKTNLNLSDEQFSKLKASHDAFASKAKDIRSNESLTMDQKKDQFKALAEQQKEETKSILTPEQLEKMKQMHKEHSNKSVK